MEEDRRAVLAAEVQPLAVYLGRIVEAPEDVEQLLVGDFVGIEADLDRLGVAGALGAGLARVVLSFEVARAPAGGTEVRSTLRATRADTPGWMWSIAQATARMLLRRVLALVRAEAERGRISPA